MFVFLSRIQNIYIVFVIRFALLLKFISSLKETMTAAKEKKNTWGKTLRKQVNSSFSVIYLQKPAVEAKGSDIVQPLETTYFLIGEETSDASIYFLSRKGLGVRGSKAVLITRDSVL